MIQSFKDRATEEVFRGKAPKGFPADLFKAARRRLAQLHAATSIEDLRTPPGNRLHSLSGDRAGQWTVRVNDQFRICFKWGDEGPEEVEFTDYH
jgi:proteic killer suppression protein